MSDDIPPAPRTFGSREFMSVLVVLVILAGVADLSSPVPLGDLLQRARANGSAISAQNLSVALSAYQFDTGTFPVGPRPDSSTAAFQVLYDGNYLTDPAEVCLPGPGRVRASGPLVKLVSQNVGWDYTERGNRSALTGSDPSSTPLIISTGLGPYTFANGANLVPILYPQYSVWGTDGITVAYVDGSAAFLPANPGPTPSVTLTRASYSTRGGTFSTVTPEVLPPLPTPTPTRTPTRTPTPTPTAKHTL